MFLPPTFFSGQCPWKKLLSFFEVFPIKFLFPSGSSHYYWLTTTFLFCFASKEKNQSNQRNQVCELQKCVDELKKTIIVQDSKLSEKESRLLKMEQEIEVLGQRVSSMLEQTTGKRKFWKDYETNEAKLNEDKMEKYEKKFKCSKWTKRIFKTEKGLFRHQVDKHP